MHAHHIWFAVGGAAVAGTVAKLASTGLLHKGAVAVATCAMKVDAAVTAETQSIVDDANDATAEARRRAKIDSAVKERLAVEEARIREEVTAKVDGEGCEA